MSLSTLLFALALLLGFAGGWWVFGRNRERWNRQGGLPRDYLQGLNFLLNEQPDKAVDIFIKILNVDSDTIETHLALGTLFRRRGEVARAIRIHQNLIARPNLRDDERAEAILALATDYLSAGVLDRAEKLFEQLLDMQVYRQKSLDCLLDIYQQEKDWHKAIDVAKKLAVVDPRAIDPCIAHYYCELAELAIEQGAHDQAHETLKKALAADKYCARAGLLQAELEYVSGRHKHAVSLYRKVGEQNPDFLSETIVPLANIYQELGEEEMLWQYVRKLLKRYPGLPIVLLLVDKIKDWKCQPVLKESLLRQVRKRPSISGIRHLMTLRAEENGILRPISNELRHLLDALHAETASYRCESCGFSAKVMCWLCPGCKSWNSVKSVYLIAEK